MTVAWDAWAAPQAAPGERKLIPPGLNSGIPPGTGEGTSTGEQLVCCNLSSQEAMLALCPLPRAQGRGLGAVTPARVGGEPRLAWAAALPRGHFLFPGPPLGPKSRPTADAGKQCRLLPGRGLWRRWPGREGRRPLRPYWPPCPCWVNTPFTPDLRHMA